MVLVWGVYVRHYLVNKNACTLLKNSQLIVVVHESVPSRKCKLASLIYLNESKSCNSNNRLKFYALQNDLLLQD